MRKQNFDIVGQQIVTKFLEKETKKKKKGIYLLWLKRYLQLNLNLLNRTGKHSVPFNIRIKFPWNLFVDKIWETAFNNISELSETLHLRFPNNSVSIRRLSLIQVHNDHFERDYPREFDGGA